MNVVRVGIVGAGSVVGRMHLPYLASHPRVELAALCSRRRDVAQTIADTYAIPKIFSDFGDLIANGRMDAVLIATPDDLHYPMTMAAVEAGLHVLCEKPLALNAADAREMRDAAVARSRKHMVFFRWRWLPQYEHLRTLIHRAWIGWPLRWELDYLATHGLSSSYTWRFDERRSNGALGDLGSHMLDLAIWLGGGIRGVRADLSTQVERVNPDDATLSSGNDGASVELEFSSGAHGLVHVSAVTDLGNEPQRQTVRVTGTEGWLEVELLRSKGATLRGARNGQALHVIDVPHDVQPGNDLYDTRLLRTWAGRPVADHLFIDAILNDLPLSPSFDDGISVQEVIDAAFESHRRGGMWIVME